MIICLLLCTVTAAYASRETYFHKLYEIGIHSSSIDSAYTQVFKTTYTKFPVCVFRWGIPNPVCCVNEDKLLTFERQCSYEDYIFSVDISADELPYDQFYSNHSFLEQIVYSYGTDNVHYEDLILFQMATPRLRLINASQYIPYPYKCYISANNNNAFVLIRGTYDKLQVTKVSEKVDEPFAYLYILLKYNTAEYEHVDCFMDANAVPFTTNIHWQMISIDDVDYVDGTHYSNETVNALEHKTIQVTPYVYNSTSVSFTCFTSIQTKTVYWSYITFIQSTLVAIQYQDHGEAIGALDGNLEQFECGFTYREGSIYTSSVFTLNCTIKLRSYAKFRCATEARNFMPVYYIHLPTRWPVNNVSFIRQPFQEVLGLRCFATEDVRITFSIFKPVYQKWEVIPGDLRPDAPTPIDMNSGLFYNEITLNYTGDEFQQIMCNCDNRSFPEWYIYWSKNSDLQDSFPNKPLYLDQPRSSDEVVIFPFEHDPLSSIETSVFFLLKILLATRFLIWICLLVYLAFFAFKLPSEKKQRDKNQENEEEEEEEEENEEEEEEEEEGAKEDDKTKKKNNKNNLNKK